MEKTDHWQSKCSPRTLTPAQILDRWILEEFQRVILELVREREMERAA